MLESLIMARKSGVFKYIELCLKENILSDVISWKAKLLTKVDRSRQEKCNYYILRNPEPLNELNPFKNLNYKLLQDQTYAAHLSFFESFHSDRSDIAGRRDLSYCHGTEYFISSEFAKPPKIIIVHYHFNMFGTYIHATCRDQSDQSGNRIPTTPQQEFILRERAQQYQEAFQQILEKKNAKYLALSEKIAKGNDELTLSVANGSIKQDELIKKVRQQCALNTIKDSIGDFKKDSSASFRMFEKIITQFSESNSTPVATVPTAVASEVSAEYPEMLITATAQTPVIANQDTPIENTNNYQDKIAEFATQLDDLSKISKTIKASSDEQQIANYLNALIAFRTGLFVFSLTFNTKKIASKLHKLSQETDKLKKPEQIFEAAIKDLNLAHIKASFEFCSHLVSYSFFSYLIDEWVVAAKAKDVAKEDKIAEIADFFSESSDSFLIFIKDISKMIYMRDDGSNSGFSVLGLAYISGSKKMFAAMLDYGFNVHAPLGVLNGEVLLALACMRIYNCEDDFYIHELIAHGLRFNERIYTMTKQSIKESLASTNSLISRRTIKELNHLEKKMTTIGVKVVDGSMINNNQLHKEVTNCEFIKFTEVGLKKSLILYAAYAKYCPLSSLLFSAACIATRNSMNIYSLSSSKRAGLELTHSMQTVFNEVFGLEPSYQYKNILNFIDINNKPVDSVCVKMLTIICDMIRERFSATLAIDDFENALAELDELLNAVTKQGDNEAISGCYIATVFLFGLKGGLSATELLLCVQMWHNAGQAILAELEKAKDAIRTTTRDPNHQEEAQTTIAYLRDLNDLFMSKANEKFMFAVQLAYLSPYPEIIDSKVVEACFTNLKYTIERCVTMEAKSKLQAFPSTAEKWQQKRDMHLMPKQQPTQDSAEEETSGATISNKQKCRSQ